MKKIIFSAIAIVFSINFSYAQWSTGSGTIYPTTVTNTVGIGTSTPAAQLHVVGTSGANTLTLEAPTIGPILNMYNTSVGTQMRMLTYSNGITYFQNSGNLVMSGINNTFPFLQVGATGLIGIGLYNPQAKLHLDDNASSSNPTSVSSGNMIIQTDAAGRSSTSGSSLEFAIPANTDGTNAWGQARIITVAGNGNNNDATGKLILGTRRYFNKGSGIGWNYGDDITIDGGGNVGIGEDSPDQKLTVDGNIHAQEVLVNLSGFEDRVFKPKYHLPTLPEVKTYIDKNHHLPDVPSEAEVVKNGLKLGDMERTLTKKVEELTLYLIDKDKQLAAQQRQINALSAKLDAVLQVKTPAKIKSQPTKKMH